MPPEMTFSRGDQRRLAIIEAAKAVFLENGFAGTTLDQIIERSGGSRRTLYEQFGNKEGLFSAVLCHCCENVMGSIDIAGIYSKPPREALTIIGETFFRAIVTPLHLAIYRSAVSEVTRFPEIGDVFFRNGPGFAYERLAAYLELKTSEGVLNIPDVNVAASLFMGMIKSELHLRAVLYPGFVSSHEDIERHVGMAVDCFLAAYHR